MTFIERLIRTAASLKTALVLMTLTGLTALCGTVIPQNAPVESVTNAVRPFFGGGAESAAETIVALGLTNYYRSPVFLTLLVLFALNLTLCTLRALPQVNRSLKAGGVPEENPAEGSQSITLSGSLEEVKTQILAVTKKVGYSRNSGNGSVLFFDKGRVTRYGFIVLHIGILVVLAGGLVGLVFGFKGTVSLLEGKEETTIVSAVDHTDIDLGFSILNRDFTVDFYPGTDSPRAYRSILTIRDGGMDVVTQTVDVNVPLTYNGVTFYQSSYGFLPNRDVKFRFLLTPKGGEEAALEVPFGEDFPVPGTSLTARVADFSPALALNDDKQLYTYAEQMMNPAALIEVYDNGTPSYRAWVLSRVPETWTLPDMDLVFVDAWGVQYSGLSVRKDPGVPLVYTGFAILVLGTFLSFLWTHSRLTIWLVQDGKNVQVYWKRWAKKSGALLDKTASVERVLKALGKEQK